MESDYLKKYLTKVCNFLFFIHNSTFKRQDVKETLWQAKVPIFSHVVNEIDFYWPSMKKREICVDVVQELDGCHPLLIEKWVFLLDAAKGKKNYQADSQALRSFLAVSKLLPSSGLVNKVVSIKDSSLSINWPNVQPEKLIQYPARPYQVFSPEGSLLISVQYYLKSIKPVLIKQKIASRRRLNSETDEFVLSPPVLPRRSTNYEKVLTTVTSQSLFEEQEVGIQLITSEVYDGSSFEKDASGKNSFDMEIDIPTDTPEEAMTSIYMINCDKIRELSLFGNSECLVKDAVDEWKKLSNM